MNTPMIGLGDVHCTLCVCIGNRPNVPELTQLTSMEPLHEGDIARIVEATGNHWRKIFNIFAKLMYGLEPSGCNRWQDYRDQHLLQAGNRHALLFSAPDFTVKQKTIWLISGKHYAEQLGVLSVCDDLGDGFYLDPQRRVIVTPYFDYRQLSNVKIERLFELLRALN